MKIQRQLVTFFIVGLLNTLVGYSLYAICVFVGIPYAIAVIVSTCCGVLFNYKTLGRFVFDQSTNSRFLQFVAWYGFLCLFNMFLITWLQLVLFNLYWSGLVATISCAGLSFFVNKYWVFRETS